MRPAAHSPYSSRPRRRAKVVLRSRHCHAVGGNNLWLIRENFAAASVNKRLRPLHLVGAFPCVVAKYLVYSETACEMNRTAARVAILLLLEGFLHPSDIGCITDSVLVLIRGNITGVVKRILEVELGKTLVPIYIHGTLNASRPVSGLLSSVIPGYAFKQYGSMISGIRRLFEGAQDLGPVRLVD